MPGHFALFVIDAVEQLDLTVFFERFGPGSRGRPAYPPQVVAVMLYAYAQGVRSLRAIERRCVEDVAFRVICANLLPDHATIARFRAEHEPAAAPDSPSPVGPARPPVRLPRASVDGRGSAAGCILPGDGNGPDVGQVVS